MTSVVTSRNRGTRSAARTVELLLSDVAKRRHRVARHDVGGALRGSGELLRTSVDERGAASNPATGLDVIEDVADHPRPREVDIEVARGVEEHARRGLAARAIVLRRVGAEVDGVEPRALGSQLTSEMLVHRAERGRVEVSARDARLVRDDDDREAVVAERGQLAADSVVENEIFRPPRVVPRMYER